MKKKTLIILFLKKNIFSIICLLLSFFILVMGTVSYSKYVNSDSSSSNSSVGSFAVSASVDSISGLSFTNTDFWSSSSVDNNDKIAMNVLRNLNFSVNNFKTDESGNTQVSDVRLKYNLSFSAPKVFAEKLAFQVFDDNKSPIIPQIVIADLLNASDGTYDTSSSTNYEETNTNDLKFSVKKEANSYIATSSTVTIKIEKYNDEVDQTLLFRMWDTSTLTNEENRELEVEGGKILPPLEINFNQSVEFYRITIVTNNFILPAGKAQTDNYAIKLVTTSPILDEHLGSTIVKASKNSKGDTIGYSKVNEIYGGSNNNYYLQSIYENYEEKKYDNPDFVGSSYELEKGENIITGSVNLYKDGTTSKNVSSQIVETITKEETVTSNKITSDNISWNTITVVNDQITLENYKEKAIAKAIKKNENTVYYICKLDVQRNGIQNITFIDTNYKITPNPNSSVKKQKEITENSTVERLDGEVEIILLNTIKITKNTYSGYFTCDETTTTRNIKRNYFQKGFIYRAYYEENGELKYLDGDEPLLEVISEEDKLLTNKQFYLERINVTSESHTDSDVTSTTPTTTSAKSNITIESYDYIQKKIERTYRYDEIVIDQVEWSKYDANGTLDSFFIDDSNILKFYENNIQKYWLAQCYSKNYPFYVDVIFEQTQ